MRAAWALLILTSLPVPASGATFIYLASESAQEQVAFGRRIRLTEADTPFAVYPTDTGGLTMFIQDPAIGWRYFLYFYPPVGQRFAPGSYDGTSDCGFTTRPGVCVERELYGEPVEGHMDVREAAYGADGRLLRFAVDFSQRAADATRLTGSVRWNSGDGACVGTPDGTSCDDVDLCTPTSACVGGRCVAASAADCGGPPAGPCHDAAVCDPAAGTCLAPSKWNDGISCQLDACALVSYCADGVCTPDRNFPLYCSDGDSCTYDVCNSATGCASQPIPGSCGHAGLPGAFVFVQHTPAGTLGDRLPFTAVAGPETAMAVGIDASGAVSASVAGLDLGGYWSFAFAPPEGTTLAPGVYENVAANAYFRQPTQAALDLFATEAVDCAEPARRFMVREIATDFLDAGRGHALAFSADFEVRCPDGQSLTGAVRFRAGDPSCVGAPDGSPCDDLNACTRSSSCQGGFCVGADPVVCPPAADGCHATPPCDPTTGGCVAPAALPDGTSCDDATTCVHGTCSAGTCTSSDPTCDDRDPCTVDRCDGAGGCVHDRDRTCWQTVSRAVVTAQASGTIAGHDVACGPTRCQQMAGGALFLNDDGTYRSPANVGGPIVCPSDGSVQLPDEIGTLRRASRGRLVLRPKNLADIKRAIRKCTGRKFSIRGYRAWIRLGADGNDLVGRTRLLLTVADQLPIQATIGARMVGKRGAAPTLPLLPSRPPLCSGTLSLSCHLR